MSADGRANLFTWSVGATDVGAGQAEGGVRWAPAVDANLYLEHVGAAALGRLVPTAALTPSAGSVTGQIRLVVDRDRVGCQTTLTAENLVFTPNLESPVVRPRAADLARQLAGFKASGPVLIGCEGSLSDASFAPLDVIQTTMTQAVTRSGPPLVRAVGNVDRARVAGTLDMSPEAVTAELGRQVAAATAEGLGGAASRVVNDLLAPGGSSGQAGSEGSWATVGRQSRDARGQGSRGRHEEAVLRGQEAVTLASWSARGRGCGDGRGHSNRPCSAERR